MTGCRSLPTPPNAAPCLDHGTCSLQRRARQAVDRDSYTIAKSAKSGEGDEGVAARKVECKFKGELHRRKSRSSSESAGAGHDHQKVFMIMMISF